MRRAVETSPFVLKERKEMEYRTIYRNTLSKKVYVFESENTGTLLFYRFPYPMGMEAGFYEYWVAEAGGTLELSPNDIRKSTVDGRPIEIYDCGVARVGKMGRNTQQYNLNKTYEQYR